MIIIKKLYFKMYDILMIFKVLIFIMAWHANSRMVFLFFFLLMGVLDLIHIWIITDYMSTISKNYVKNLTGLAEQFITQSPGWSMAPPSDGVGSVGWKPLCLYLHGRFVRIEPPPPRRRGPENTEVR